MVTGVLGPGGIWGWVQGVGSDHWGTRSQPWAGPHLRAARMRADAREAREARFLVE